MYSELVFFTEGKRSNRDFWTLKCPGNTYNFVKDGLIIVDIFDDYLDGARVVQLRLTIVTRSDCDVCFFLTGRLVSVEYLCISRNLSFFSKVRNFWAHDFPNKP